MRLHGDFFLPAKMFPKKFKLIAHASIEVAPGIDIKVTDGIVFYFCIFLQFFYGFKKMGPVVIYLILVLLSILESYSCIHDKLRRIV